MELTSKKLPYNMLKKSVADPDLGFGIGAFLTPGSAGIRNRFIPDPWIGRDPE